MLRILRHKYLTCVISAGTPLVAVSAYSAEIPSSVTLVEFKIPQHSVADALILFAEQSGEQIIFPYDEAKDIPACELSGRFGPIDALAEILKGTGLLAFRNPEGTIVIRRNPNFQMAKAGHKDHRKNKSSRTIDAPDTTLVEVPGTAPQDITPEEIVITGSRLKRAELTAPNLVSTIESKTVKRTGTANIENLLNKLPQIVPSLTGNSNNPGEGIATVDLRGLGPERTLVLVNGRRYVPSSQSGIIDLNSIPTFLLDKVEVATGGTSAVYGADAIAGVVNFKLRDDFAGFEGLARYRISKHGDGEKYDLDLVYGEDFDDGRGSAFLHLGFLNRHPVMQGDRDFSTFALRDAYIAPNSADRRFGYGAYLAPQDGGVPGLIRSGSSIIPGGLVQGIPASGPHPGLARFGPDGAAADFDIMTDSFNYAPYNFLQLPQRRLMATFGAKYRLTESVEFFNQTIFSQNKVDLELAPTPLLISDLGVPVENPFLQESARAALRGIDWYATGEIWQARDGGGNLLFDGLGNPVQARQAVTISYNPDGSVAAKTPVWGADGSPVAAVGATTAELAGNLLYIADGQAEIPALYRRMIEMGPRQSKNNRRSFNTVLGLRGELAQDWGFQAYYNYSAYKNVLNNLNAVSLARLRQAANIMEQNGEYLCADPSARQEGCVPANIFGENNLSPDAIQYLTVHEEEKVRYIRQDATAFISGALDHGIKNGLKILLGVDWRKEDNKYTGDQTGLIEAGSGFLQAQPATGAYDVWSLYGEIKLPLLENITAFEELELSGALRYSDYSLSGAVWSAATGFNWRPVTDLRIRGQYQRAVREPNIQDLFSQGADNYPAVYDPCAAEYIASYGGITDLCIASGVPADQVGAFEQLNDQIREIYRGNPDLEVEKSDTFTIGLVYQPTQLPEMQLTLDYYHITLRNQITAFAGGAQGILDSCYGGDSYAPAACDRIHRQIDGRLDYIDANLANMGQTATSGIDGQLFYQKQFAGGLLSDHDRFELVFQGTYLISYDYQKALNKETLNCAGLFNGDCGEPLPRFRFTQSATWYGDMLEISLRWRHFGGVRNQLAAFSEVAIAELPAKNYFDLYLQYRVTDDIIIRAGVDNIFDNTPDFVGSGQQQANTFPNIYDVLGSYFHFGINIFY